MILAAHRCGTDKYPELTIEAARYSLSIGADYVEMDIRFTSDDVPVISHDKDGTKLFGIEKNICDLNLEDFLKLRFVNMPEYHPHTLEEILASGIAPILFHIKEGGEYLDIILTCIRKHKYEDKVILGVQEIEDVFRVKRFNPEIKVLAFMQKENLTEDFLDVGADIIRLWATWVNEAEIKYIHQREREIWIMAGCPQAGTVGYAEDSEIREWKKWKADGIIINEIGKTEAILKEVYAL